MHRASALRAVAELAEAHGVTVISDEIHGPLVHRAATFTPYLSVSDAAREHGIALSSASKAFNLAGIKCALMVAAGDRTAAILDGLPAEVLWRTSLLGLHAAEAAFTLGDDWLDGTLVAIENSATLLRELLGRAMPAVVMNDPRASYLAWLDFRPLGWGDDPTPRALAAGVALSAGPNFGTQGRGFARLNLACAPDVLEEAVARLRREYLHPAAGVTA